MSGISAEAIDAFIAEQTRQLAAYDATRPKDHPYAFDAHSERVAKDMHKLALRLDKSQSEAEMLYRATLMHDIGKMRLPVSIWDVEGKPEDATKTQRRKHTQLGVNIVNDHFGTENHHPILDLMRDLMANHHEAVDGSGWRKLKGEQMSLEARMLCICDAFDGYSSWRPHFGDRDISVEGVLNRMQVTQASQYDAEIMTVFAAMKRNEHTPDTPAVRG